MLANRMLLVAFALACSLLARNAHAMLVTPATQEESEVALDQAIVRRNAAEINSADFKRLHERLYATQTQALNSVKSAIAHPDEELVRAAESADVDAAIYYPIVPIVAMPVLAFVLIAWLTRRALASRERERLAMLKLINPSQAAMEAVKAETKIAPAPKLDPLRRRKLQEIWALTLARMQNEPHASDLSHGANSSEPLASIPTPV